MHNRSQIHSMYNIVLSTYITIYLVENLDLQRCLENVRISRNNKTTPRRLLVVHNPHIEATMKMSERNDTKDERNDSFVPKIKPSLALSIKASLASSIVTTLSCTFHLRVSSIQPTT